MTETAAETAVAVPTPETPETSPAEGLALLNLDAGREARAAQREERVRDVHITFGGERFPIPPELPVDVLTPLKTLDLNLGLLMSAADDKAREDLLRSMVIARPYLVAEGVEAVAECLARLIGQTPTPPTVEDGPAGPSAWSRFVSHRPSPHDYLRLGRGLLAVYGLTLGELFGSFGSSETDGETQKQTSNGSTDSTVEEPSPSPAVPASSAPGA